MKIGERRVVLALLALAGCRINYDLPTLDVQPAVVCPGDHVMVHWLKTQDTQTVSASPAVTGFDPSAASGTQSVSITAPTTFTITSPRPGDAPITWVSKSVSLFTMTGLETIGFCSARTATVAESPSMVPASVTTIMARSTARFPVVIQKDGATATIPPMGAVPFRVVLNGDYNIVPQGAAANCPPPPPPQMLTLPPPPPGTESFAVQLTYACP